MNTAAILQAVASQEVTDRGRGANRGEGDDGGFRELLSRFAASDDRGGAPTGRGTQTQAPPSSALELLEWLRANAQSLIAAQDSGEEGQQGSASDEDGGERNAVDTGEIDEGGIDAKALLQALSAGDAAAALAALNRRAPSPPADGDVPTGPALPAQAATPEEIIRAALAKAAGKVQGEPDAGDRQRIDATMTVIGRETHLAPTQTVESESAGSQWAVELATRRNMTALADATAQVRSGGDAPSRATGDAMLLRAGVAPSPDTQLGPEGQGGNDAQERFDTAAALVDEAGGPATPGTGRAEGGFSGVVQQVASHVADAASAAARTERPGQAAFVVRPESAAKVLHLQLQPADLGTVTIRLSVKDKTLRLDLEVGRGETAHFIQRERETLSALLRSAGYSIDGLDVRLAEQTSPGTQGGAQSGLQMQGGQSGSSQPEGRFAGQRPHGEDGGGHPFGGRGNGDEEQAGQGGGRGGVYL